MRSDLSITLILGVCVMTLAVLGVDAASVNKPADHHQDHCVTLDLKSDPPNIIRSINNNSISPWVYTEINDPDLLQPIRSARCLLTGCLNVSGEEVLDVESRPILTQILVLRRVKADKKRYHLRAEYRTVSVGCTCVRPYVQHV